jgi:hypothetical protein
MPKFTVSLVRDVPQLTRLEIIADDPLDALAKAYDLWRRPQLESVPPCGYIPEESKNERCSSIRNEAGEIVGGLIDLSYLDEVQNLAQYFGMRITK